MKEKNIMFSLEIMNEMLEKEHCGHFLQVNRMRNEPIKQTALKFLARLRMVVDLSIIQS